MTKKGQKSIPQKTNRQCWNTGGSEKTKPPDKKGNVQMVPNNGPATEQGDVNNKVRTPHDRERKSPRGFLAVYNVLRCIKALDGQDAMILSAIAEQLRQGKSRLSLGWIASRAMTSKRTVRRRIRRMHALGLLRVQRNGVPLPNDYRLAGQALALLRDAGISAPDADSMANLKEYSDDREGSGGLPSRAAGSSRDVSLSDARGLK